MHRPFHMVVTGIVLVLSVAVIRKRYCILLSLMISLLCHQLSAYLVNKLTFFIISFLLFVVQSLRQYLNIHSSTFGGSNHSLFKQSSSPVKEMKVCVCACVRTCVSMCIQTCVYAYVCTCMCVCILCI